MAELKIVTFEGKNETCIRQIRTCVFIEEQGVDPELDFDGLDESAIHVIASLDGLAVATGRMLDDGHIGRIAVLKDYRGRGIGSKIMSALIDEAKKRGYKRLYLGAQTHALGFYSGLGFTPYGDEFLDAGMVHQGMERLLTE